MTYTEIKKRNNKKYYYRAKSIRNNDKVSKERIYLGVNLSKSKLSEKELEADKKLIKKKSHDGLNKIKPKIIRIIKKMGIKKAGIFGSYARGEQTASSDVDILIKPTKKIGFFEIVRLEDELGKKTGKRIDLLTYGTINKSLRKRILKEEVRII